MEYVYLVIVLALIEYFVFGALVGRARGMYGVKAPACTGPEEFERAFRVQQNTLEWLIVFIPAMWICGTYVGPMVATGFGVIGIVGRAIYARAYIKAPEKRGPGMMLSGIANMGLLIGSLVGIIQAL
ncbi:MAG: MAPEG family protein [Gammaproteobacteria bacterium]|jgi:glutathione S-transferase